MRRLRVPIELTVLLVAGAFVRLLVMIAYPPALFFGDSWGYVVAAYSGHPVALSNIRPSGYPALLRLLTLPGRDLLEVVTVQHVAGLAAGALVYVLLRRAEVPRILAAPAAALILLDGYAIALEQHLMAEPFFTLTLLVVAALLSWPVLTGRARSSSASWILLVAGLLLAGSVIQRTAGLFVIPVFLIYLLWERLSWRRLGAFALAVAVPVVGYAAAVDSKFGTFGLTQTEGWLLYGRVAGFADCAGAGIAPAAGGLCETPAMRARHPMAPTWYVFAQRSPAVRLFGGYAPTIPAQRHSNAVLGAFARRIIVHQPLDYLGAVGADVARFFTPGATQFNDAVSATSLPGAVSGETIIPDVRRHFLPDVHPVVQSPSGLVRAYRSVIHVPRPVLAVLALVAIAGLVLRVPGRREVWLFAGSGLAMLLGDAATAGFGLRYLMPVVPFLAVGGTLAGWQLWRARG